MAECTIYDKLRYIQETKDLIKAAIESQDVEVLESATFRQYADYITQIRKVSSVNGMQGDVTITLEDLGGITKEELDSKGFITAIPSEYITQDELSVQLEDKVSENGLNEAIEGVRNEIPNTDSFLREDNIKTINGESIVGEGNIQIEGGEGSGTDVIELTQDEYNELEMNGSLQDAFYLLTDVDIPQGGGNANVIELTQAEYEELERNGELQDSFYLLTDVDNPQGGGNANVIELTQDEYDNLEEKVEGTLYVISDAQEITVPIKLSQLENDSNYVTKDYLNEIIGDVENKITEINELI